MRVMDPLIPRRDEIRHIILSVAKDQQFQVRVSLSSKIFDRLRQKTPSIAGRRHHAGDQRLRVLESTSVALACSSLPARGWSWKRPDRLSFFQVSVKVKPCKGTK